MKTYAQVNQDNQVTQLLVGDKKDFPKWASKSFGGTWIEAFEDGGIRKNYPQKGYKYDSELDAFIPPKPFDSWVLDEETAQWEAPVEYPSDGKDYSWDEETTSWVEIPQDGE